MFQFSNLNILQVVRYYLNLARFFVITIIIWVKPKLGTKHFAIYYSSFIFVSNKNYNVFLIKMTKYILLISYILFAFNLCGQNSLSIYKAYINDDMELWKQVIDAMEKDSKKTNETYLELLNYQYGYISWCIKKDKDSMAEKYMEKGEKIIAILENQNYHLSELYSYKSAFIGFEIGISPYKAPFISSESLDHANKAVKLNPNKDDYNPYLQLGNIYFYMPKMFGGSKKRALTYYLGALDIMERKHQTVGNWNYLNLLAVISNAYIELENYEKAKEYCRKALDIEPNFKWVKNKIYPKVLEKL